MATSRSQMRHAKVSASIAGAIAAKVAANQQNPRPLFAKAGIDIKATEDPTEQIRLDRFTYLLHLAAEAIQQPHLGLELGAEQNPAKWGAFGYVVLNSPTVGMALKNMANFHRASQDGTHVACVERNKLFGIEYSILLPNISYKSQDAEFSMAYTKHVVDLLCEKNIRPQAVHFEHPPLGEMAHYKSVFGIEPLFEQPVNGIFYPLELSQYSVFNADLQLYPILSQHLKSRIDSLPDTFNLQDSVAYHIRQNLVGQQCKVEQIAKILATSPRSLQRRLKEEGSSFTQVLENVRRELAYEYLEKSAMEIKEIGYLLGFADTSAFIRAFKKWHGMTPGQYREQARK